MASQIYTWICNRLTANVYVSTRTGKETCGEYKKYEREREKEIHWICRVVSIFVISLGDNRVVLLLLNVCVLGERANERMSERASESNGTEIRQQIDQIPVAKQK